MAQSYVLSCCSTVDITREHLDARDIHFISFHFRIGPTDYVDDLGKTMDFPTFYETIQKEHDISTSQVNINEYLEYFETFLSAGQDVLHCTLSSGISGTYNSACNAALIARERYPERKIYIVDSLCASAGFGLFMDELADKRDSGMGIDELRDWAEANKLRVHHHFFSTDLSFFVRGGRISKTSAFFGGMLNICPLLTVNSEGKLIPKEKLRGKKQVIKRIVKRMEELADNGAAYDGKCYISHAHCLEDAQAVAALIEETIPAMKGKIEISYIGTTIGVHTGPGTVALFFFGKERTL